MTKPIDLQKWYKELIPRTQAITHRNTSITNAFANALYPIQIPSEDVIKEVFNALGQDWKAGRITLCLLWLESNGIGPFESCCQSKDRNWLLCGSI